jgi:nucleoid-associated protein YgaU
MKRFRDTPACPFLIAAAVALALVLALLLLSSCGAAQPARGSAQDDAAAKQARAKTMTEAADDAAIKAAALQAQATLDAAAAQATRIPADIEKAAQSRAAALVAKAIADAVRAVADRAETAAEKAQDAGRLERAAEAKDADARAFAFWCRWIGLGGVLIGAVIGMALARLVDGKTGAWIGGGIVSLGFLATAFGSTVTWLPVALIGSIVLGLGAWALFHGRQKQVGAKLSHLVDTIEGNTDATVAESKAALASAVKRSGLGAWFDRLRAGWYAETKQLDPVSTDPSQAPTVAITKGSQP